MLNGGNARKRKKSNCPSDQSLNAIQVIENESSSSLDSGKLTNSLPDVKKEINELFETVKTWKDKANVALELFTKNLRPHPVFFETANSSDFFDNISDFVTTSSPKFRRSPRSGSNCGLQVTSSSSDSESIQPHMGRQLQDIHDRLIAYVDKVENALSLCLKRLHSHPPDLSTSFPKIALNTPSSSASHSEVQNFSSAPHTKSRSPVSHKSAAPLLQPPPQTPITSSVPPKADEAPYSTPSIITESSTSRTFAVVPLSGTSKSSFPPDKRIVPHHLRPSSRRSTVGSPQFPPPRMASSNISLTQKHIFPNVNVIEHPQQETPPPPINTITTYPNPPHKVPSASSMEPTKDNRQQRKLPYALQNQGIKTPATFPNPPDRLPNASYIESPGGYRPPRVIPNDSQHQGVGPGPDTGTHYRRFSSTHQLQTTHGPMSYKSSRVQHLFTLPETHITPHSSEDSITSISFPKDWTPYNCAWHPVKGMWCYVQGGWRSVRSMEHF